MSDFLSIRFQVKKLNDSLESTAAKLEESKQLLKTNENGKKRQNYNYNSTKMGKNISFLTKQQLPLSNST